MKTKAFRTQTVRARVLPPGPPASLSVTSRREIDQRPRGCVHIKSDASHPRSLPFRPLRFLTTIPRRRLSFLATLLCLVAFAFPGRAQVWLTNNLIISESNTNYDGQRIVIWGATVTIDGTHMLDSLLVTNHAVLTHSAWTTNASQRMNLVVSNGFVVDASSRIDVSGKGYSANQGPGAGEWRPTPAGGGGYGGMGGNGGLTSGRPAAGGAAYGSLTQPTDLGSGGGGLTNRAGSGGGSIRLAVGGLLQLDGQLRADGGAVSLAYGDGGGGAGGSIYVTVGELRGAGTISSDGGAATGQYEGGGGGGGRIAVYYGSSGFAGTLSARGGDGYQPGGSGTVVLTSTATSNSVLIVGGSGSSTNIAVTPIVAGGQLGSLVVSNGASLRFDKPVTLSGNAQITGTNTVVEMIGQNSIEQNMAIQNGALLTHPSGVTNTELRIGGDLLIDQSSKLDVSGKGYSASQGPGAGEWRITPAGGGGYGGMGGNGGLTSGRPAAGGAAYGSLTQPTDLGSGGGGLTNRAGSGGGSIRLAVGGLLQVDGQLRADGGAVSLVNGDGGGGAGGSIYVTVGELRGAGTISAGGGAGSSQYDGGGGGGGRIAVYYGSSGFAGTLSAHGGSGYQPGGSGTIVLTSSSTSNSVLIIGGSGSNTNTALTPIVGGGQLDSLVVSNGAAVSFAKPVTVSGDVQVSDGATVSFGRAVTVSGNVQITGTNSVVEMIGQNSIERHMVIQNGGLLTHSSGATNTEVRIGGDLLIDPSSKVDVSGKGYSANQGPGAGESRITPAGGGGYGGTGGNGGVTSGEPAAGGVAYGSLTQPTDLGSGGGGWTNRAGAGGGSIRLAVGGLLQVDGQLRADGGAVNPAYGDGGGGSGGSIYVTVGELRGAGAIAAEGGAATSLWLGGGAAADG